jgi:hemerythrin
MLCWNIRSTIFTEEEKLLDVAKCDGLVAHKKMHEDFVNRLKQYREKAEKGMEAFITTTLMKTLNDWLVTHIGRMDQLYTEPMHAAGIR